MKNSTIDLLEYMPKGLQLIYGMLQANIKSEFFKEEMTEASKCPCKELVKERKKK